MADFELLESLKLISRKNFNFNTFKNSLFVKKNFVESIKVPLHPTHGKMLRIFPIGVSLLISRLTFVYSEYDICAIIESNADDFCPAFPDFQPCHCPLLKGHFEMSGVKLEVPSFGALDYLMVGSYKARATFYGKSTSDRLLGCMDFDFKFVKG